MSLLSPQRWKYRKQMRSNIAGVSSKGTTVAFGDFGLKAVESAYISSRQIESARKIIARYVKKVGKMWLRIFPDVPYTRKGLEMPMGKGKGEVDHYQARVLKGKMIFEVSGLDQTTVEEMFRKATHKLPMRTRTVQKGEIR